ncbi:MAG: hypothetical protein U0V75_06560 [Ferruginibacter sp.]
MKLFKPALLLAPAVLFLFILLITAAGCGSHAANHDLEDSAALKASMVESIRLPFKTTDTLLLAPQTTSLNPGNNEPVNTGIQLHGNAATRLLSEKLGLTVITLKDYIDNALLARGNEQLHCGVGAGMMGHCMKNKLTATLWTDISAENGHILLHENYLLNDSLISLVKEFYSAGNKSWQYKIIQTGCSNVQGDF